MPMCFSEFRRLMWVCPVASLVFLTGILGCVRVKTDPIRIEPIYIEITINHKVQQELDDLFADIDQASETADFEPLTNLDEATEE